MKLLSWALAGRACYNIPRRAFASGHSLAASACRPDEIDRPNAQRDSRSQNPPRGGRRTRRDLVGNRLLQRAGHAGLNAASQSVSCIAHLERLWQAADGGCRPTFGTDGNKAHPHSFGGGSRPNTRSRLNPMASNRRSLLTGPSSSNPTGRPAFVKPTGRLRPGIPALLPGSVLRI
jgi:hypothetical protein